MRIALNGQLISLAEDYRAAGVSAYSLNLLRALGAMRMDGQTAHTFHAYVNEPDLVLPGVHVEPARLPLASPLARIAWEQTLFPLALARHQDEAVHGLVNVLPLASRRPGVVTVHDLSFVRTPEALPAAKRAYLAAMCRRSVEKAQRVIAVSQQTADDLMEVFGTPARRIEVIYNGVGAQFAPAESPAAALAERSTLTSAHDLPARFLLYLGTLEPRKNLPLLLQAFAHWRTRTAPANRDVHLVLAGGKGWFYEQIFAHARGLGLEEVVYFPGFIPAAALPAWYRAALAFVYPSRFEGFGLPVAEAMASGTPVITSRAPSLLEVVADAALTFPVNDLAALADCIELVVGQSQLRAQLVRRGLARASLFTWHNAARQTLAVYDALEAGKNK